jgi:mannitol-1-/sugar-/sorbitol-6-/2-deoxyglucose-6-phosphatase
VGIEVTDQLAEVTAPMTPRQVTEHWYRMRPWDDPPMEYLEAAVVARVAEQFHQHCPVLPGVHEVLALCGTLGWRVGLASNSPRVLCDLVLARLGVTDRFQAVVSADHVEQGKPDPSIYLLAARMLGVEPRECLAFEDSLIGVRAARAAGMRVVAVTAVERDFSTETPNLTLATLENFDADQARRLWSSAA